MNVENFQRRGLAQWREKLAAAETRLDYPRVVRAFFDIKRENVELEGRVAEAAARLDFFQGQRARLEADLISYRQKRQRMFEEVRGELVERVRRELQTQEMQEKYLEFALARMQTLATEAKAKQIHATE